MINSNANRVIVFFYDEARANALPDAHGEPEN
jgi:hypothetical protein